MRYTENREGTLFGSQRVFRKESKVFSNKCCHELQDEHRTPVDSGMSNSHKALSMVWWRWRRHWVGGRESAI